jgi:hypothetical protein
MIELFFLTRMVQLLKTSVRVFRFIGMYRELFLMKFSIKSTEVEMLDTIPLLGGITTNDVFV